MRSAVAYIIIASSVFAVAAGGSMLTQSGMDWYATLRLPDFTPPGSVIGMAWTVIFALSAVAVMLIWKARVSILRFRLLFTLLIVNGLLNMLWSYLFFVAHQLGLAIAEMILLNLVNLLIIVLAWNRQRIASLLFIPYFAWVCFATYLAVEIWRLNR